MHKTLALLTLGLFSSNLYAQEVHDNILDFDLSEVCNIDVKKNYDNEAAACEEQKVDGEVSKLTDFNKDIEKFQICSSIGALASSEDVKPVEIDITDDQGNPWKLRFHFGFTRTNYRPTDVKLESSQMNTTIKGFEFDERTSANHYNPKNWKEFQDAFRWIDEPTNTIEISVENKKNAFYLTVFHPKTLATHYQKDEGGGNYSYIKAPKESYLSIDPFITNADIPDGHAAFEIQNTHKLMNYSLGYGRKFKVFDKPKTGQLDYVVRVDGGVIVGAARSLHFTEDGQYSEGVDKNKVQGFTGAVGHRVEFKRGKVGAFVEQKYTKTKLEHGFLDGKASYNLDFSTITFGLNVDLFTKKNKKNKK